MDIIIGGLFILFMFLVDYRLNKIYKELKTMNEAAGVAAIKQQEKPGP